VIEPLTLPLKEGDDLRRYLDFMSFRAPYRASFDRARTLATELQALALGPLRVAALPGEPFAELGLELKRREGPTLVVGFANDDVRYVMTDDAYVDGQYETVGTPLGAGSAAALVDCAAGLAASV
jgi:hypothetical protein